MKVQYCPTPFEACLIIGPIQPVMSSNYPHPFCWQLTLANTLDRALGTPREVEPKVTNTARLRPTDREANPSTAPRRDRGRTCTGVETPFGGWRFHCNNYHVYSTSVTRNRTTTSKQRTLVEAVCTANVCLKDTLPLYNGEKMLYGEVLLQYTLMKLHPLPCKGSAIVQVI